MFDLNKYNNNDNKSAYVEKQRKLVPFTILPIGDNLALEAWKKEQVIKEKAFQAKLEERFQKDKITSVAIMTGDVRAPELSLLEKYEILYIRNRYFKRKTIAHRSVRDYSIFTFTVERRRPRLLVLFDWIKQVMFA